MSDYLKFLTDTDPEDETGLEEGEGELDVEFDEDTIPALDPSEWLDPIPQIELIDLIDPNLLSGIASLHVSGIITKAEARKTVSRWLPIEVV